MKYIAPTTTIRYAFACNILAESNSAIINPERINYLCPYDKSRCRKYNRWLRQKKGVKSLPSDVVAHKRISVVGDEECPWKNDCSKYSKYVELTGNDKQH